MTPQGGAVTESPYEILGVPRDASPETIKRAYRTRALACHPDRHPDDPAKEAEFRCITEAYTVLADPVARERYDRGDDIPAFGGSAARDVARRHVERFLHDRMNHSTMGGTR